MHVSVQRHTPYKSLADLVAIKLEGMINKSFCISLTNIDAFCIIQPELKNV